MAPEVRDEKGVRGVPHLECVSATRPNDPLFHWYGLPVQPFCKKSRRGYMSAYLNYALQQGAPPEGLAAEMRDKVAKYLFHKGTVEVLDRSFEYKVDEMAWKYMFRHLPEEKRPLWPWPGERPPTGGDRTVSVFYRDWVQRQGPPPQQQAARTQAAIPTPAAPNTGATTQATTSSAPTTGPKTQPTTFERLPKLNLMAKSWSDEVEEKPEQRPSYASAANVPPSTRGAHAALPTRGAPTTRGRGTGRGNPPPREDQPQRENAPTRGGNRGRGSARSRGKQPMGRGAANQPPRQQTEAEQRMRAEMDATRKTFTETLTLGPTSSSTDKATSASNAQQKPAPSKVETEANTSVPSQGETKEVVATDTSAVGRSQAAPTRTLNSSIYAAQRQGGSALQHRPAGQTHENVQWTTPSEDLLQRLCVADRMVTQPGATVNQPRNDSRSRAAMWAKIYPHLQPHGPICGHFELCLSVDLPFDTLVIGNGGVIITEVNKIIDPNFVLTWATHQDESKTPKKKLILSFRDKYNANSVPQQWAMKKCWENVLLWACELWRARVVPLDVWIRTTSEDLVPHKSDIAADPYRALMSAYQDTHLQLESKQAIYCMVRKDAVRAAVRRLEDHPSVDGAKDVLEQWMMVRSNLDVPDIFDSRDRLILTTTIWYMGLMPQYRHHALRFLGDMVALLREMEDVDE